MRKFGIHYLAGAALVAATGGAQALGFDIEKTGGSSQSIKITTVGHGASPGTVTAGAFKVTPDGSDGAWPALVPPGSFISYCTQINQYFSPPQHLTGYSITTAANPVGQPPVDGGKLAQIGQLMTYAYSASGFGAGFTDDVNESAVQAAIWEILYEGDPGGGWGTFNLGTGTFATSSLSAAQTTAFAAVASWIPAMSAMTSYQQYALLTNADHQDFLVPVPEPEAYGLALAGLGVVAFMLRRRRAAAAAA